MRIEKVVVVGPKRLWQLLVWGTCALLVTAALLGVSVVRLLGEVADLRQQVDASSADRARQFAEFNARIDDLTRQLATSQADSARKDARIKQLTDQLLDAGITPVPAPSVSPSPSPSKTTDSRPSPRPSPQPTRTATPRPSPSPSCLLPGLPRCLTPPPFRLSLLRLLFF